MNSHLYPKNKRGTMCCAVGCSLTSGTNALSKIRMFCFPKDEPRRTAWVNAVRRKQWLPTAGSRLCSTHFHTGQPSKDPNHPDWVPSLFAYNKTNKADTSKMNRYWRHEKRNLIASASQPELSADTVMDTISVLDSPPEGQEMEKSPTLCDVEVQTTLDIDEILKENSALKERVKNLEERCTALENRLKQNMVQEMLEDESVLKFYTGLPNKNIFLNILSYIESIGGIKKNAKLSNAEQLILTLMKLRHGFVNKDLAFRFGINQSLASKIFQSWLDKLYTILKDTIKWPSKKVVEKNLPPVFSDPLFDNIRCIVDCSETQIQRPHILKARAETYSNYKGRNTMKFLVAISPNGYISFISKAWGGRVSDKELIRKCGLLDLLEEGDTILADRGFNINDLLAVRGIRLVIPHFTKGKKQLHGREILISRKMSHVRIHVERAIGRLKTYKILSSTLPISLIKKRSDVNVCTIDKILVVCSVLSNLQKALIN